MESEFLLEDAFVKVSGKADIHRPGENPGDIDAIASWFLSGHVLVVGMLLHRTAIRFAIQQNNFSVAR